MTTPISTLPELRDALKADRKAWPGIAKATGISENTLRKLAYGDRKNPTYGTLQPLFVHFNAAEVTA